MNCEKERSDTIEIMQSQTNLFIASYLVPSNVGKIGQWPGCNRCAVAGADGQQDMEN
jgi:hypothetical protein